MKLQFLAGSAILFQQLGFGADTPPQWHRQSLKTTFSDETEVKAFYDDLLAHNTTVKQQFDQFARQSPTYGDVHFGRDDPLVIEWVPSKQDFDVEWGYSTDAHYLLVQRLTFTRPRQHDSDLVVVSEFRVVNVCKSHPISGPKGPNEVDSAEITITFLGFRDSKFSPIDPTPAKQGPDEKGLRRIWSRITGSASKSH